MPWELTHLDCIVEIFSIAIDRVLILLVHATWAQLMSIL